MSVECAAPVVSPDAIVAVQVDRAPATPAAVAALTPAADAASLGAALALALARAHRAPVVVVCIWTGDEAMAPARGRAALPAARRLAAALAARGHEAWAAGRLVLVGLAGPGADAALEARRALVAAGAVPSVLALGGPRAAAFDALLADHDLVVVASRSGADAVLTRLAIASLDRAARACACEVPAGPGARSLALAGVLLLPSARRALAAPMAELA